MRLILIFWHLLSVLLIQNKCISSNRSFRNFKTINLQLNFAIEPLEMVGKPKISTLRVIILGRQSVSVKPTKMNVLGDSPAPNGSPQVILSKLTTLQLSSSILLAKYTFLFCNLKRLLSAIRGSGPHLERRCLQTYN